MSENTTTPDPATDSNTPKLPQEKSKITLPASSRGGKAIPVLFVLFIVCIVTSVSIYLMKSKSEGIVPIALTPIALAIWCLGQMVHSMSSKKSPNAITFHSHSEFFYYWPLWLVSFIFGDITLFFGTHVTVEGLDTSLLLMKETGYGITYILVMAFALFATGVNLRGVWALLTMVCIVFTAFIMLYFGVWDSALSWAVNQPVYLNHGFYLAIGVILFIPWCIVMFFFDSRKYVKIESNTVTVVHEIGEGERAFDTIGVMMEKKLDNFFKHYLLGFGSGDLIIRTSGGSSDVIYLPNVLHVNQVLKELEFVRAQRGRI